VRNERAGKKGRVVYYKETKGVVEIDGDGDEGVVSLELATCGRSRNEEEAASS